MISFKMTHQEEKRFDEWSKDRRKNPWEVSCVGGQFVFTFSPCSIGTSVDVMDTCTGETICLTDYSHW